MPAIKFKHFDSYRASGVLKGIFLGGCVERGDGSSFRAKAHAHTKGPWMGWICVRSRKRLMGRTGKPSNLMLHELAHLIVLQGHTDKWRECLRDLGGFLNWWEKKRPRGHRHAWAYIHRNSNGDCYRCVCGACRCVPVKVAA